MSIGIIVMSVVAAVILAHVAFAMIALRRNPPIGGFMSVDGVRLHYVERGPRDGQPLVMLHGNGAMIQEMIISGLVDLAAAKYRVICFDRPGFGHSSRPRLRVWTPQAQAALLAGALRKLDVSSPIVLGHSWGALVAVSMAAALPVKGLVVVSGYYFPTRRLDVWMLSGPAIPIIGDVMRYTLAPLVSWAILPMLLRTVFSPTPVPLVFEEQFPKSLALRPLALRSAAEESAMMVPSAAWVATTYDALTCPVAIVAGSEDKVVEKEQGRRLHAALLRSVLHNIPGTGHMTHHQAPERIVAAIDLIKAWPA